ncbi:MAG: hypothetical protein AAF483_28720 [Planctomycetota bacterium]
MSASLRASVSYVAIQFKRPRRLTAKGTFLVPVILLSLTLLPSTGTVAQELDILHLPTFGGKVFWTDYVLHRDWRIQQHSQFGHFRLLDGFNRRIAFGSMDECYRELERRRCSGQIRPMPRHVVIVMHGLAGTRGLMSHLARYIEREGGYTVLNFGFASTQGGVKKHTIALESVLRNLQGVDEVSFVCHSMSNIMVRHLLYRMQRQSHPPHVCFRRMVMISPPNQGVTLADTLGQRCIIQFLLGKTVDELALKEGWRCLERELETPHFQFGIIAGGKGNDRGYLGCIPGDDDGVVELSSHYLTGARDFTQVGGLHQIMPLYPKVKAATVEFLDHGHF